MAMEGGGVERVRELQRRGEALRRAVSSLPSEVLTPDCRARLLKVVQAERHFVERLACEEDTTGVADAHLSSSNFGHLEGIVFVLQQQGWRVAGANAALKTFQISSLESFITTRREDEEEAGKEGLSPLSRFNRGKVDVAVGTVAHVDVVCTLLGEAVWVVVINSSAQNRLWSDQRKKKGIRPRICTLLHAASLTSVARPSAIVLVVRDGLESRMEQLLRDEFKVVTMCRDGLGPQSEEDVSSDMNWSFQDIEDGDWVDIRVSSNPKQWTSYWIRITSLPQISDPQCGCSDKPSQDVATKHILAARIFHEDVQEDQGGSSKGPCSTNSCFFWSSIKSLQFRYEEYDNVRRQGRILNMDTTALVALVSEMTNGGAGRLVQMTSEERERRFPSMAKFVYAQALVEQDKPFLPQFEELLTDKLPVICEYVYDEFTSIALTNGGPCEKQRAQDLLSHLKVVPNMASARVMALPETGKIKARHKFVFGCGDFLQAPTVTANMAFVRAVHQQGMALAIIQHQPCALTGD